MELSRVWPHLDSVSQQLEETRAELQEAEQANAELQTANSKLTAAAKRAADEHELSMVRGTPHTTCCGLPCWPQVLMTSLHAALLLARCSCLPFVCIDEQLGLDLWQIRWSLTVIAQHHGTTCCSHVSLISSCPQEREKRLAAAEAEGSLHRELQAYAKDLAEAKAAHSRVSDEAQAQLHGSKNDHQAQLQVGLPDTSSQVGFAPSLCQAAMPGKDAPTPDLAQY